MASTSGISFHIFLSIALTILVVIDFKSSATVVPTDSKASLIAFSIFALSKSTIAQFLFLTL